MATSTTANKIRTGACLILLAPEMLLASFGLTIMVPERAYAYVDPSVMTYTIQAIAGVAVALSAVAGVAMRRTRRKLFALLKIDENANKFIEPNVHELTPDSGQATLRASEDFAQSVKNTGIHIAANRKELAISWPKRLGFAALISLFVSITYLLIAPFEIVAGSESSLVLGLSDIAPISVALTIGATLAIALILSLVPGRAFWYGLSLTFAIGLSGWLQAMFLNTGLPTANGASVAWDDYDLIALVSLATWTGVILASILLAKKKLPVARIAIPTLSIALVIVQGVGAISLVASTSEFSPDGLGWYSRVPTEDGLFEVSDKKNVIVFVLDTYDTKDIVRLQNEGKDILKGLEGFTWFKNTTGAIIPTRYAIPFLLTGELPRDDDRWSDYLKQRYKRSSFLADIYDAGYSIGLYSDSLKLNFMSEKDSRELVAEKTINLHKANNDNTSLRGTARALIRSSLYRDLPWILKPRFWFTTDWMNFTMTKRHASSTPDNTLYVMDDAAYYSKLKKRGLDIEKRECKGAFRFIHLLGTHKPYNLNARAKKTKAGKSTLDKQAIGSMKIVKTYLDFLREKGLYDDACIIITADHGILQLHHEITKSTQPIMLVKPPAQSHEEANRPVISSNVPTVHADIIPTIIDAIGGTPEKYSGAPIFDVDSTTHDKRTYLSIVETDDYKYDDHATEWEIKGDTVDFSNWNQTGRSWNARE